MVSSSGVVQMLEWVKEYNAYATTVRHERRKIIVASEIAQPSLSIKQAFETWRAMNGKSHIGVLAIKWSVHQGISMV